MLLPTANACNVQGVSKERKNLLLLYKREEILHCVPLDIFPNDRNFKCDFLPVTGSTIFRIA